MKYFSVPADFKTTTIDRYVELNNRYPGNKISETYGQATRGNIFSSGRTLESLPPVSIDQVKKYAAYSQERGIGMNYALNASCLGNIEFSNEGIAALRAFLKDLYEGGIKAITVAIPSMIELIREMNFGFDIKASTILQVSNVNRAILIKNMGIQRMVVDESLNRDFNTLKRIRDAFGEKTEIIVNSVCHKDCVNRMFHYNQIAHDSADPTNPSTWNFYSHRCMKRRLEKPGNILRLTWIRPEDLHYYSKIGIRYFKIRGRQSVMKGDPVRTIEAYFKESFDGDLLELMDLFAPTNSFNIAVDNKSLDGYLQPFFASPGFCREECTHCHYCDLFAEKIIDKKIAEKKSQLVVEFYQQFDNFTQALNNIDKDDNLDENKGFDLND